MERAHLIALLYLPGLGPLRLRNLLAACPDAAELWWALTTPAPSGSPLARRLRAVELRGRVDQLFAAWAEAGRTVDPKAALRRHRSAGVELVMPGDPAFPDRLHDDEDPPTALFARGDLSVAAAPTVAIVGTRRATPYGLGIARRWAMALVEVGVAVVSGLARGIDAAAHDGALAAMDAVGGAPGPVGVVGTGLDVVYPRSSARLWSEVGRRGVLISEAPLGVGAQRWRFPARNRIIAGLADAVLVVESHERGGALSTADEALGRQRPVLAVPGSVHASSSAGTNHLLRDGALVATCVQDVLLALPTGGGRSPLGTARTQGSAVEAAPRRPADPEEAALLLALGWEPALVDRLVERTDWSLGATCRVLERLVARGLGGQQGAGFPKVRE